MKNDASVLLRLPSSIVSEIDRLAKRLSRPGLSPVSRSEVMRMLVIEGLKKKEQIER